ncbi:MAG: DUF1818 family protein [Cyanobacteria bacterium J06623_7]
MKRSIKSGVGWRVGWHPEGDKYQGLIGTDEWAFELTKAELIDFRRLVQQLAETMAQIAAELMAEEKISCEAETELLWVEVSGYSHSYSLRVILNCDRRCEGNWNAGVVSEMLAALSSFDLTPA